MKISILIIVLIFSLGCSNSERDQSSGSNSKPETENGEVTEVNSEQKEVKEYKSGSSMKLNELVELLLPDDGNTIVEWSIIEKIDIVKDLNSLESFYGEKNTRGAMADINLILGPSKSEDLYDYVSLYFHGNGEGYNEFEISVECAKCFHENEDYLPEDLFKSTGKLSKYKNLYNLKVNGKSNCWFFITRLQCGGRTHWADEFSFKCFFSENDALNDPSYKFYFNKEDMDKY